MRSREVKFLTRGLTSLGGSLLATLAGLAGLFYFFSASIARLSYDLPFAWRDRLATHEVALVYLDDDSAKKLHQPLGDVWNRALHTQLLDRLTSDHARLVFYDIAFDSPGESAETDAAFAAAIARHGHVVLGAALDPAPPTGGVIQERILPPTRVLRKAAAGWGLLAFKPVDADYGVRQLFTGTSDKETATWKAADLLGAKIAATPRETQSTRWLNYYGPPYTFASVNFAQAIEPDGVPTGYFNDRIVMIGGRAVVGYLGLGKDEFATPFSASGHGFSTGLEIHATILLNLLRGEWLTRMPSKYETGLVLIVGLFLGALALMRPLYATSVAVAVCAILLAAVWLEFATQRLWFSWLVPVAIQVPVGLFWSLGSQYYLEARRRKELRRAFGFYLSPLMAEKISDSDFDLTPGGKTVEATIMFTDLEGFTTFSEDLSPEEVSKTLIEYFERTTRCILERRGTIVKYVGDAVMAGWGAPVDEPAHAMLAAEAACELRCLADMELRGRKMRTRVGVNTGKVLAGNLGSSFRFDYSMIGDTTNFASRLEALNKHLGTQVLISESTRAQLSDRFLVRRLGEFRAAGKAHSVSIHELICPCDQEAGERKWIEVFESGLALFQAGDFAGSRERFEDVSRARGAHDAASDFFVRTIAGLEKNGHPEGWTGVIEMTEK